MTATLYDAGPTSCVILIGGERATYSRRAVERVLTWLDTEVDVPVSDDMGVWLGLHVVPVGVLRAAAAEMGQAWRVKKSGRSTRYCIDCLSVEPTLRRPS